MRRPLNVWHFGESRCGGRSSPASERQDNADILAFVDVLFLHWLDKEFLEPGGPGHPGRSFLRREALHPRARENVGETLIQLFAGAPRWRLGVPLHWPDLSGLELRIWVDCFYAEPPFLATAAQDENRAGAERAPALEQELLSRFADMLRLPETGNSAHGGSAETQRGDCIVWGRGNGWALLGTLDAYECIGPGLMRDQLQSYICPLIEQILELEVGLGK